MNENRPNLTLPITIAVGFAFMANDWIVIYRHDLCTLLNSRNPFVLWRLGEAALLSVGAISFLGRAAFLWIVNRDGFRLATVVAGTLFTLALTDVVEAHAGAWCRPWWILAYRVPCITIVLALSAKAIFARWHRREMPVVRRPSEPAA